VTKALDPDRWRRVSDLFDRASELPSSGRSAFLDEQCGDDDDLRREVESLLEHDQTDGAFESGVQLALGREAMAVRADHPPFERLGPYRLVSEIGRGGMGTVYLAERDGEIQRRVAIKLVRAVFGGDLAGRFQFERQILASLQHPGIARLVDGGTTPGGLPYLVMEHVDGVPIDAYCEAHGLGVRDRLALFRRVCAAVSHAHRRLVVHRDLKPSNILVTADGTPKLLDFGIAKLLAADVPPALATAPSMRLLTPEYASPEQIHGQPITTAADVYSLGALLFELLTAKRPRRFESNRIEEIARVVDSTDVPRPSTVVERGSRRARELAGDLDTIVMTALAGDPARRYGSVEQLSDDVQRFLDGRAVTARPATWQYRVGLFVNRHRAGVVTAAAFAVLVIGLAAMLARSIVLADRERDAANRVSTLLLDMFADPSTSGLPAAVTTRERLDRGVERVRRDLRDQPAIQARLFEALGAIYGNLGLMDQAQSALRESMAARDAGGAADSPESARTMWRLADALRERGQSEAAEPLARQALEMMTRYFGRQNPQTGQVLNSLGMILMEIGRRDEAEPMFVEATEILRNTVGPQNPLATLTLSNLAAAYRDRGDLAGAERIAREAFALRERSFGVPLEESIGLLADVVRAQGRPEEADQLRRDAARQARPRGLP
jgi:tetratricopeptide (TPR) repeat protein